MTTSAPIARYLGGTAFIVYGPGLTPHNNPYSPPRHAHAQAHAHAHDHSHSHSHHTADHDQPASFWAIIRPTSATTIISEPHSPATQQQQQQHDDNVFFFLQGTPHPWGSYPSDMEEPHGCMPPHLYYRVTISEHTTTNDTITTITSTLNKWELPYVHRIGDGNDEAGGLTTIYTLLRDQEDAEDHGAFIHTRIRHFQSSPTSTCNDSPITPSLYACTQILISERRTMDVIQQQFFSSALTTKSTAKDQINDDVIPGLKEFRHHLEQTLQTIDISTEALPFSLVQSDLKLILPCHTPFSSTSST